MGKTRSAGWIGGTAVLIVAILVATYFLLYVPRADEAAATLTQAEETRSRNDILEVEVAGLAAKAEHLEVYTDALNEIATQIPDAAELAQFTEMVRTGAEQSGVLLEQISPGVPVTVTIPTPAVVAPVAPTPPAEGTEGTDSTAVDQAEETAEDAEASADAQDDTSPPEAPAAPAGPQQVEGLVAVPVTIKVLGTYGNVLSYVDYLQMRPGRLFLVSDLTVARQKATAEGQGKPALADGDLEVTMIGYFYVLRDTLGVADVIADLESEGAEPTAEPTEEPTEEPMPTSPNNPFVPLVPSEQTTS